jgi:hypothetical protein
MSIHSSQSKFQPFPDMLKRITLTTPLSRHAETNFVDHAVFQTCRHWLWPRFFTIMLKLAFWPRLFPQCWNWLYWPRPFPDMLKLSLLTPPPPYLPPNPIATGLRTIQLLFYIHCTITHDNDTLRRFQGRDVIPRSRARNRRNDIIIW